MFVVQERYGQYVNCPDQEAKYAFSSGMLTDCIPITISGRIGASIGRRVALLTDAQVF